MPKQAQKYESANLIWVLCLLVWSSPLTTLLTCTPLGASVPLKVGHRGTALGRVGALAPQEARHILTTGKTVLLLNSALPRLVGLLNRGGVKMKLQTKNSIYVLS